MENSDLSEENSEENKIMKSENNEVSVSFHPFLLVFIHKKRFRRYTSNICATINNEIFKKSAIFIASAPST